jgi:hypothetical protein
MPLRYETGKQEKEGDDPCQLHENLLFGCGRYLASDFRPRCHPWTELKVVNPIRKEMSRTLSLPKNDGMIDSDNIVEIVILANICNFL